MSFDSYWYYAIDGRQHGPVAAAALREMLSSGQLTPSDLVWCEGMADWSAAANVPSLGPIAAAPPIAAPQIASTATPIPTPPYGGRPDVRPFGGQPIPYYPSGQSYNALAIVGFVLALTPMSLVGLILSLIALNGMKNSGNYEGRALAKAGVIIPCIFIGAALLFGCLWFTIFAAVLGMGGHG